MQISATLTFPQRLRVERLVLEEGAVTVHASATSRCARCPMCGRSSRRVHGRYTRTLADLPWGGVPVRLRVRVRKFFCDGPSCVRKIFAERLEAVARPFARGTDRQREALEWIAFALGGEAGARLARELGLLVSPATLLNRIRGYPSPDAEVVRVLGVDDFAFKKGDAYGTILVDLKRRRVVDLLPDRSAEPLEEWLKEHPGVEVVARDRSFVYARGIAAGAPEAEQVADRWHLLHGLALALEDFLLRKRLAMKKAAEPEATPPEPPPEADGEGEDVSAPGHEPQPAQALVRKTRRGGQEAPRAAGRAMEGDPPPPPRGDGAEGDLSHPRGERAQRLPLQGPYGVPAATSVQEEGERPRSLRALPGSPMERGVPQRQAPLPGDTHARVLSLPHQRGPVARRVPPRDRPGQAGVLCSPRQEGSGRRLIPLGQERRGLVHAPRGEADGRAKGLPEEVGSA